MKAGQLLHHHHHPERNTFLTLPHPPAIFFFR
jgi:hypothetical protein